MAGNTGVLDISSPIGLPSCLRTKRLLLPCRASVGTGIGKKIHHMNSSGSYKRVLPVMSALISTAPSVSMRTAEKSIQLPIDYYQILGAESHYLADAMVRAYEARAGNPPTEGFSQETLKARQQILKVACDTLADRDLREEYDNGLKEDEAGTLIVDVPWSKIPGALCLLQEVGEAEVVLQVGEALLDENLKKPFRQDVVLVMALAYVELSREAMAEVPPAVVRSCDMLNAALRLLKEGGSSVGTTLQEQIYETLEEITPRCVLELLGLPLEEEHKAQRAEGLQEVRKILWTMGEGLMAPVGAFTREQFMKEALSRMTANEQVALFTETPSNIPAEKLEVYSAALAHVAEGFSTKKPRLIQEANNLFTQLQESLHRPTSHLITDEQRDVILGRALTALLLGEVENCKRFLGLDNSNSPFRCPAVVEFVISNSDENEDNDLLSGMCKLLESWLVEEVFTNFRETTDIPVSLSEYYDDPEVLVYLEKLEKGSLSASKAPTDIARIGAALDSLRTTFERVFPSRKSEERVVKEVPVAEDMDDSTSLVSYGQPAADTVSKQSRHGSLPLQIACVSALFGGMVIASLQYPPLQKKALKYFRNVPVLAALSSAVNLREVTSNKREQSLPKEAPRMDVKLAEQLIRKWQSVKAQGLGVNHAFTQLNEVLDGQMLKIWTDRAVEVSKHGWYWEYKLLDLNIDSVTISEDGTRATVEATLQEAARLYDSKNPQYNDSYTSSYTTRYDFHRGGTGWKITNGAVLRSL